MEEIILQNYTDLANAIIVQAVSDYRSLLSGAKPSAEVNIPEVERFFESNWFEVLTNVDGVSLMRKIQKECSR